MRKFTKSSSKSKWVDFPDDPEVKLKVQPITLFKFKFYPFQTEEIVSVQDSFTMFKHCLVDWEGLIGEDGKKLEVNEENKAFIFDFAQDIVAFVFEESTKMKNSIVSTKAVKNLSTSQPGEMPKKDKK